MVVHFCPTATAQPWVKDFQMLGLGGAKMVGAVTLQQVVLLVLPAVLSVVGLASKNIRIILELGPMEA